MLLQIAGAALQQGYLRLLATEPDDAVTEQPSGAVLQRQQQCRSAQIAVRLFPALFGTDSTGLLVALPVHIAADERYKLSTVTTQNAAATRQVRKSVQCASQTVIKSLRRSSIRFYQSANLLKLSLMPSSPSLLAPCTRKQLDMSLQQLNDVLLQIVVGSA